MIEIREWITFRKQEGAKLTKDQSSPFYEWNIKKLKPYSGIQWKHLLEYGVVKKVENSTAYIYYNTPPIQS